MSSLIVRTAARVLMPLLLMYGIFLLLRGHNAPGGGFAGGLVVAAAYSLSSFAFGPAAARRALIVDPSRLIGVGLLLGSWKRHSAGVERRAVSYRAVDCSSSGFGYSADIRCGSVLRGYRRCTDDDIYCWARNNSWNCYLPLPQAHCTGRAFI